MRAAPLFLLGAVVGGAVGGVTGALTTLLWLQYADEYPARPLGSLPDGGAVVTESPAAATRERSADGAALELALNDWLEATKKGDIEASIGPERPKPGGTIDPAR